VTRVTDDIAAGRSDLRDFRQAVRRLLERSALESEVRAAMSAAEPYDAGLWKGLSGQLGIGGLLVPEELGGSGAGQQELGVVMHELGRTLAPAPVLSTVALGVNLLVQVRDEWVDDLLRRIAAGEATVAVALADTSGPWGEATAVTARAGESTTATGAKRAVVDAHAADVLLVLATSPSGPVLLAVNTGAEGVHCVPVGAMDLTRSYADLSLLDAPARVLATGTRAVDAMQRARQLATVALAAECCGIAERSLERAVQHAKSRIQFGRPIGSFQAVRHKCARMLIVQQLADAIVDETLQVADRTTELEQRSSAALAVAGKAAYRIAADTIQVHGGIGFTWEDASHLFFKRASSNQHLLGEPRMHADVVARTLGLCG
jgi:alkylation response protein AidB-like acyl-CoA dehydrogenase